jgi:hypothetical protein
MAPPSPLAIASQAVNRLVKEESYYHKEQASQEKRIKKLKDDIENKNPALDSNAEYILKQEVSLPPSPTHSPPIFAATSSLRDAYPNPQSREPPLRKQRPCLSP